MLSENMFAGFLQGGATYFDDKGELFKGKFKVTTFRPGVSRIRTVTCEAGKPQGELMISEETDCSLLTRYTYKDGLLEGKSYVYSRDTVVAISVYEKIISIR